MAQKVDLSQFTGDSLTVGQTLLSLNNFSIGNTVINQSGATVGGEDLTSSPTGATVYTSAENFPLTGLTQGEFAFANNTNSLYVTNGSGWYRIALVNQNPTVSANIESARLGTSNTSVTFTYTASDPEDLPVTVTVSNSGIANTSEAVITHTAGNNTITFTNKLPRHVDASYSANVTLTASDGVNFGYDTVNVDLVFDDIEQFSNVYAITSDTLAMTDSDPNDTYQTTCNAIIRDHPNYANTDYIDTMVFNGGNFAGTKRWQLNYVKRIRHYFSTGNMSQSTAIGSSNSVDAGDFMKVYTAKYIPELKGLMVQGANNQYFFDMTDYPNSYNRTWYELPANSSNGNATRPNSFVFNPTSNTVISCGVFSQDVRMQKISNSSVITVVDSIPNGTLAITRQSTNCTPDGKVIFFEYAGAGNNAFYNIESESFTSLNSYIPMANTAEVIYGSTFIDDTTIMVCREYEHLDFYGWANTSSRDAGDNPTLLCRNDIMINGTTKIPDSARLYASGMVYEGGMVYFDVKSHDTSFRRHLMVYKMPVNKDDWVVDAANSYFVTNVLNWHGGRATNGGKTDSEFHRGFYVRANHDNTNMFVHLNSY